MKEGEGLVYNDEEEQRIANERVERLAEDEELDPDAEAKFERARHERMMNAALFGEGYYHLIPSFYRTLMYLKKQKRDFSCVFRSFGSDCSNLVNEFNRFCAGHHPSFNGKNDTPLVKFDHMQLRKKEQRGVSYRVSPAIDDMYLVTGEHKRVVSSSNKANGVVV